MLRDLIQAWRALRQSKGYTAAAVLTLALGLGANAAVWTAVLGAVLRPLKLPQPERLVWVGHAHRERGVVAAFSPQDFATWRAPRPTASSAASRTTRTTRGSAA